MRFLPDSRNSSVLWPIITILFVLILSIYVVALSFANFGFSSRDAFSTATPLIAAALALFGVTRTIRNAYQASWWSRAQWAIDHLIEAEDETNKQIMLGHLNYLIETDPPSREDSEQLSRLAARLFLKEAHSQEAR